MGDYDSYVSAWRARAQKSAQTLHELTVQARKGAEAAAQALAERFHPSTILLVGSLHKNTFRQNSDIDFVVEGIDAGDIEVAEALARDASGFPVDILRLEAMSDGWREHHLRFGETMYVRT